MNNFRVIPVLDILNNVVVHAVRGFRNEYKPIRSRFINSSNISDVIEFYNNFGFQELYIADLDLIINHNCQIEQLKMILSKSKMKIMIDAGIRNLDDLKIIKGIGFHKIILGSETIESLDTIKECIEIIGKESVIISVDMRNNQLMTNNLEISKLGIQGFVGELNVMKIHQIILLDMGKVGSKSGCYDELYGKIREKYPNISILIGGGARNIDDLVYLKEKKMNGVLIASALYDGSIAKKDLESLFFS